MNILILTASLPYPPTSGGAIRVYGMVRGLHKAGHTLTLLALAEPGIEPPAALRALCREIITVPPPVRTRSDRLRDLLFSRQPDIARRLYSDAFAAKLRELLGQQTFDLIQIEAIEMACYLPLAKAAQPTAHLVFDTFNAEYMLQRVIAYIDRQDLTRLPAAVYSSIQSGRIEQYEAAMCRLADAVIAVSPEDGEALRRFRPDGIVHLVPSGIFVADYHDPATLPEMGTHSLVFTGKMDYRPNVDAMLWFASEILPLIRQQTPNVRLYIVGQQPHPRLDVLRSNPAVTITGRVDSVQPYLNSAAVYIAPLRMGSGTRLKLLEALASGCTIVATEIAAAGLVPEVKHHMVIADEPLAFARAVDHLLQDTVQRRARGLAAREAVRNHYDWSAIIPRLLAVYRTLESRSS